MTDKEAMKLALFALDIVKIHYTQSRHINEAITALKERLAQPKQEPVAEARFDGTLHWLEPYGIGLHRLQGPLYTTPPQRTEQERDEILQAITDPENQPSQFGTVTLEYHQEKMKQWEDLFDRMSANFERASDKAIAQRIVPLYTHPPQRTWIGLEGAEFGWFCHTDFLNARKYTKDQRKKICCQLLSEAQSWDIGEYQLMMHDSTKLKENT